MEKYINYEGCYGPGLQNDDYRRVIDYLKEKIKEQNITLERVMDGYNTYGSYCARKTKRIEEHPWYEQDEEKEGRVYYYNIYFLFLGRNPEGELSIYQCGCIAEGYRDVYPFGLTENIVSSLGRIYDIKIENLLPPTFCFIKDILFEKIGFDEIEIIDQPDSGYEHDFQYIKLKCDKNDFKGRWFLERADDIYKFIDAEGELVIRPLDSDPEDLLEETPFILTKVGKKDNECINKIKGLVDEVNKRYCHYPTFSKYFTIYKDDKILIFKEDGVSHLVIDPEVIKNGVDDHLFCKNNYTLGNEVVSVKPVEYDTKFNNYKDVYYFKGNTGLLNVYGDPTNLIEDEQLYIVELEEYKQILLSAGPLITDKVTKKQRRLVYTFDKKSN